MAKTSFDLNGATHLVLPGVGAFDWAMARLEASGMRDTLNHLVLQQKKPVLGICVGMQMMARCSDEGHAQGLGWFDASVKLFASSQARRPFVLPHMGWNDVEPANTNGLLRELGAGARFYFLHSYFFSPNNVSDVLAWTEYGGRFASAVCRDNIYGVQFHPEKSHAWGLQLLKNFALL